LAEKPFSCPPGNHLSSESKSFNYYTLGCLIPILLRTHSLTMLHHPWFHIWVIFHYEVNFKNKNIVFTLKKVLRPHQILSEIWGVCMGEGPNGLVQGGWTTRLLSWINCYVVFT
jgi:hypothetical protein